MAKRRRNSIKNYPSRQGEAEAGELSITKEKKGSVKKQALDKKNEKPRNENTEIEIRNRLIMKVGVTCVMAVIFIIWIFNLKHEFIKARAAANSKPGFNWDETRQELDKTMKQVKEGIAQIKELQKSALLKEAEATPEQINLLKEKLLQETATSTNKF